MTAPTASGCIDLSGYTLAELLSANNDALDEAIRRVVDAAEEASPDLVSAFNSAI